MSSHSRETGGFIGFDQRRWCFNSSSAHQVFTIQSNNPVMDCRSDERFIRIVHWSLSLFAITRQNQPKYLTRVILGVFQRLSILTDRKESCHYCAQSDQSIATCDQKSRTQPTQIVLYILMNYDWLIKSRESIIDCTLPPVRKWVYSFMKEIIKTRTNFPTKSKRIFWTVWLSY